MTSLLVLYLLGTVHAGFAGYREATGRNLRIRKRRYYLAASLRGLVAGQLAAGLILITLLLLAARLGSMEALFGLVTPGCWAAAWVFGGYAALIGLAFLFFAFPYPEVRILTSILVFGPFTLGLPAVICSGAVTAIVMAPCLETIVLFAVGAAAMLAIEPALARLGYSARAASPAPRVAL